MNRSSLQKMIVLSMMMTSAPTMPAFSHSWYPKRCCGDMDCFPADRVERLADGVLVFTRGDIVVRVPRTFPIDISPDSQAHFCVWDTGMGFEAKCVFLPAGY